jgi:hypothetical protein
MAEITSLSTLSKTSVAATDFLLVANSTTKQAKKFQLQSLFPSVSTAGTGSQTFYVSPTLTNKNQIVFKGIKSADAKVTVTTASDNVVITLVEGQIDLSNCNNSSAGFLTSINFSGTVTGQCAVVNGGTGLATIAQGSVLYASAADTIAASTPMTTNGQLLIGNATTGAPSVATLTAGANITITNSAGGISIAASLASLAATLDTGAYNIDLNTNYLSDNGTSRGIYVHNGRAIINDSGSSLDTASSTGQINLKGSTSTAMTIGSTEVYQSSYSILTTAAPSATTGATLNIYAAAGGAGNENGGAIQLFAGNATGSGSGGDAVLAGGDSVSGSQGSVLLKTYNSSNVLTTALSIDRLQRVTFASDVYVSGPVYARASAKPAVITYQGPEATTDDGTTAISAANILTGIVKCTPTADRSKATDTASNLVVGLALLADNDSVDFTLLNLATDGTSDITLTGGSGVTLVGNMIVKSQDNADDAGYAGVGRFRVRRTGSGAVTMYRIS